MLKSICIKTNNNTIINYLLKSFKEINLDNIYISSLAFSHYKNVIIHYKGKYIEDFCSYISDIIADAIIEFYEMKIVKSMLCTNYFYFSKSEQNKILNLCLKNLNSNNLDEVLIKKDTLVFHIYNYITQNKVLNLDGFVTFRSKDYLKLLDYIIDLSVNKFVVDKEYTEFIELLKLYINSKSPNSKTVHLIYSHKESILLDENKNIIDLSDNILDIKYVSDISFSSNDLALSSLLTLLPNKIIIHIIDDEDEFINTLKLIFEYRIFICNDCKICNLYKHEYINQER